MTGITALILIVGLIALALALFVYFQTPKNPNSRIFSLLSLLYSGWILSNFACLTRSAFWLRTSYSTGSLVLCATLVFTLIFCDLRVTKKQLWAIWLFALPFILLAYSSSFIRSIKEIVKPGGFLGQWGVGFYFWCFYVVIYVTATIAVFIYAYLHSRGVKKLQLSYIAFGFGLLGLFIILVDVILPLFGNNNFIPLDSLGSLFFLICSAVAIIRYHLMDIRIIVTRVGIFFFVYFLVLWLPFWVYQQYQSAYWAIGSAIGLASMGPLIFNYLKTKAEEILRKQLKTYQERLEGLAKTEQERRQREIDHFSASLAHEIINPVFGISGMVQMVQVKLNDDIRPKLPAEALAGIDERLACIRQDADRVLKLVKTVREFSSANSGEMSLIELDKVIEGFRIIVEPQFKYNGIDFSVEAVFGIKLQANKVYLEEALMSLASNAIDAVGQNQGDKIVKMKVSSSEGVCKIDITDNGCGVEPDRLESIFLDFVTTKASSQASGMGLSRARKIIKLHNGKIWAESEGIGKGARFVIELPVVF